MISINYLGGFISGLLTFMLYEILRDLLEVKFFERKLKYTDKKYFNKLNKEKGD